MALLSTGLSASEIDQISSNGTVTKDQQQKIYSAFLIIAGVDLAAILVSLNCNTAGLVTLADLLNVKKMFPLSYLTLTVPIYNAVPGPTNSKTYYPIFTVNAVSPVLSTPAVEAIVGTTIPPGEPPYPYTDRESWKEREKTAIVAVRRGGVGASWWVDPTTGRPVDDQLGAERAAAAAAAASAPVTRTFRG